MARQPVSLDSLGNELLRPAAQPVDTFVQPGPSPLREFADSLSKIDRPLRQFLDQRAEKQAEEDALRGQAAFYQDNEGDISEAVGQGRIPAHWSPAYVRGFKLAQGNVAGNQLRQDFDAAFDAWEGKNSDEPGAYHEFVAGFLKDRLPANADPETLKGLLPHIRELEQNGQARYTQYRHQQVTEGSLTAHVAGANQDIDELDREGRSTEEGTNYPEVFKRIASKRSDFIASGGNPDDFDKSMTDAMSAKILASRDPGLLGWFDQKVPGKDYTYGESPYGAKVKLETEQSLEVIARRSVADEAEKQQAADKQRKDDAHMAPLSARAWRRGAQEKTTRQRQVRWPVAWSAAPPGSWAQWLARWFPLSPPRLEDHQPLASRRTKPARWKTS